MSKEDPLNPNGKMDEIPVFLDRPVEVPPVEEPTFMRIGRAAYADLVRRWRADAEMSVIELAEALHCEPSRIVEMELGNDKFPPADLYEIARLAGRKQTAARSEIMWQYVHRGRDYRGLRRL